MAMKITAEIKQDYTQTQEIDKARFQNKKEKLYAFELEGRLKEWGHWLTKSLDNGAGYPRRSITDSAMEGSRSTATYYPPDNDRAGEVHKAYLHLCVVHAIWAEALRLEYVIDKLDFEKIKNNTLVKRQSESAKKMGISRDYYKVLLKSAKSFVEGRISR